MKLGLTTKHYPNHGTVIVPCDSQGNALGDNVISMEVKDGIVTVQYHADESMKFGGAKGMNSGHYRFSTSCESDADVIRRNADIIRMFALEAVRSHIKEAASNKD